MSAKECESESEKNEIKTESRRIIFPWRRTFSEVEVCVCLRFILVSLWRSFVLKKVLKNKIIFNFTGLLKFKLEFHQKSEF